MMSQIYNQSQSINGVLNITSQDYDTHLQEEDEYKQVYLQARFVTGLFCYPIICFFGLTGNVLSVLVLSQRKMRNSTNCYLIALAVSDSIKLVNDFFYFMVILLLHLDKPTGVAAYGYMYPYAHYLFSMSVCVTAWLTVSVALERYIMVSNTV